MREIKFRAWDETDRKMYYDDIFIAYGQAWQEEHSFDNDAIRLKKNNHVLLPLQLTGLKDKNGKEIYEGDIFGYPNPDIRQVVSFGAYDNGESYDGNDSGFGWYLREGRDGYGWGIASMYLKEGTTQLTVPEVIGNIYENPELLK